MQCWLTKPKVHKYVSTALLSHARPTLLAFTFGNERGGVKIRMMQDPDRCGRGGLVAAKGDAASSSPSRMRVA